MNSSWAFCVCSCVPFGEIHFFQIHFFIVNQFKRAVENNITPVYPPPALSNRNIVLFFTVGF